jgi:hypothetical protein
MKRTLRLPDLGVQSAGGLSRSRTKSRISGRFQLNGKTGMIREARALLAERFGRFTLNRVRDAQGWSYKVEGSINFLRRQLGTRGWCRGPGMDRTSTRSIRMAGGGLGSNSDFA